MIHSTLGGITKRMAKIIFVKDEQNEFQAYDFLQNLIVEEPLNAVK